MAHPRKPRTPSQYSNEQHVGFNNMPPDDRTINTAVAKVNLVRPRFKEAPLSFRPLPALNFSDPTKLVNGRASINNNGQSHWCAMGIGAHHFGLPDCPKSTMLTWDPAAAEEDQSVKFSNPYNILYNAVKTAFDKSKKFAAGAAAWPGDWNGLMMGSAQAGACLPRPGGVGFIFGAVYSNGEKDYISGKRSVPLGLHKDDDATVIQVWGGSFTSMLALLDKPRDVAIEFDPDLEPWKHFRFGDATGLVDNDNKKVNGGLFIHFFNPKTARLREEPHPKIKGKIIKMVHCLSGQAFPLDNTSWDGVLADVQGYEVAITKAYVTEDKTGKFGPDLGPVEYEQVQDKYQFWWDDKVTGDPGLLYIPTIHEQCVYIAKAFASKPKVLEFGWADHYGEFVDDEIKAILTKRRTAVMPGTDDERAQTRQEAETVHEVKKDVTTPEAPEIGDFDDMSGDNPVEPVAAVAADTTVMDNEFSDAEQPAGTETAVDATDTVAPAEPVAATDMFAEEGDDATGVAEIAAEEAAAAGAAEAGAGDFDDFEGGAAAPVNVATDDLFDGAEGDLGAEDFVDPEPAAAPAPVAAPVATQTAAAEERMKSSMAAAQARAGKRTNPAPAVAAPAAAKPPAAKPPAAKPPAAKPAAAKPPAAGRKK